MTASALSQLYKPHVVYLTRFCHLKAREHSYYQCEALKVLMLELPESVN